MISMLMFLLAAVLPGAGPTEVPRAPELVLESYKLPNGLKVALHRDATVPRVTVCVGYHVGSKNERAGRTGFAHFFEHMMFKGTKNVPNYDIPLREAGAESNAFTTEDQTVYFETVPSNYLERALYLEAERIAFLPSALSQEKFDTEREVVKNERRQTDEGVPYGLAEETLLANVFPKGHPYSWPVIGSMKDLDRARLDDLKRFFAEFYHPANATLCLVGDFDSVRAKALIETYFGPLQPGPVNRRWTARATAAVEKRIRQKDEVELPRVYWAWPTVHRDHPDAPAIRMLATLLAGDEASRLHKALVVAAGVANDVAADSNTMEIAGLFSLHSTVKQEKSIAEVEAVLRAELERLRNEAPSAQELARAVANVEKSFYVGLTSPLNRAETFVAGFSLKDDPAEYRRWFDRYFRVTTADLQRVAQTYLTPEHVTLVIEPAEGEAETEADPTGPDPVADPEAGSVAALRPPTPKGGPDWTKLPGPSEAVTFQAPSIVRKTFANGLDLWAIRWRTLPIVNVDVMVPVGSGDDPPGKSGLVTLVASLLDQGTASRSATELAEALSALGATPSVVTTVDHTTIRFECITRHFLPAWDLVSEMLTAPRFDAKDFARKRSIQLGDLMQGPDDTQWTAQRAFRALLYGPEHPYGNPSQGYIETVETLRPDDVRAFHKSHFGPRGTLVIVVGDIEPERLIADIEGTLGRWTSPAPVPKPRPAPRAMAVPGSVYLVDKPGAVQSVLSVGRRWVDRHDPRYFATKIGNRVLGGDFLSRLNRNLREERGFTYGAQSFFLFRRTGSVWALSTAVRTDATVPALKEVVRELDALAGDKPFTGEELAIARGAEARSFPEAFESPDSLSGILSEIAEFGLPPDYLDTYLDQLQAAKSDEIHKAMAEVVDPKDRVVLVVGDRKAIEPKLKTIGFKDVKLITPDGRPDRE
jgi:zinc protease